jgi:GYF domain 2
MAQIYISKNGQKQGPFSVDDLNRLLASEAISGTDLYLDEARGDWFPLAEFPGFVPPPSAADPVLPAEGDAKAPSGWPMAIALPVGLAALAIGGFFFLRGLSTSRNAKHLPEPAESAATTPSPTEELPPQTVQATPSPSTQNRLRAGTFYLLRDASVTTDEGVAGVRAGAVVRQVAENGDVISISDGQHIFKVRREHLTDDPSVASPVIASRAKPAKPAITPSPLAWQEINAIFGINSSATEAQKDEAWRRFKGKRVGWTGTVVEVLEASGTLQLQIKMNPDASAPDLLVSLKKSERNKAASLRPGAHVQFTGVLDAWGTIRPTTIQDAEIIAATAAPPR